MNIHVSNILIIIISSIFLLLIPGFLLLTNFFRKQNSNIFEKLILSFCFSVIANCLLITLLHHFGLKINIFSLALAIVIMLTMKFVGSNLLLKYVTKKNNNL